MAVMTKEERIRAALAGEAVDRVPVALWRHWPIDDQDAELLAERALEYQKRYDWDFIKIPPSSTFCVADYGVKHEYRALPTGLWSLGERTYTERAIRQIADWDRIEPLDIAKGTYGRILECLRIVIGRRERTVPVVQTVFNPLAMARYLAGEELFLAHLRQDPRRVERALKSLAGTCARFVSACLDEGADGIFLSTSAASYEVMSVAEYQQFGRPGDMEVLEAASRGWFNILHIHGRYPMFTELADYPVQAVNWHDRSAEPSLKEALGLFRGALIGGVEQYQVLHFGTPAEVTAQVQDAIKQVGGRRLIIAAGCTYPVTVPECNLIAVRRAVETVSS